MVEKITLVDSSEVMAILEEGLALHRQGKLPEAEATYRRALSLQPDHPEGLHLLGVIAHQVDNNELAVDLYKKAIAGNPNAPGYNYNLGIALIEVDKLDEATAAFQRAIALKPDYAEAYGNLGIALIEQGNFEEAVSAYHRALEIKPDFFQAHNNLGNALKELGRLEEAVAAFNSALALNPDFAEAHHNLGNTLRDLEKFEESVAAFQKALGLKPDYAQAHYNLGVSLMKLDRLDEAEAALKNALKINPDFADAHYNLAVALRDQNKQEEAAAAFQKTIELNPDLAEAHRNLGSYFKDHGRLDEAKAAFDRVLQLNHGGPWWNASTYTEGERQDFIEIEEGQPVSTFRLRDTMDQLEYLIAKDKIDPSYQEMADHYRAVLGEIEEAHGPEAETVLTPEQARRLGSFYNRVVHLAEGPRIEGGVINRSLDFEAIEDGFFSSPISVTTFDDFMTPDALRALRDFCLESTIFFTYTGTRFVSSRIHYGFNCDLLYQMAEELKECFPRMLGDFMLNNMWVYRCSNQSAGVAAHTDEAAVTFNFWITPEDANLTPEGGGLIVYAKDQPDDWDWRRYNAEKYTPAVAQEIAEFLDGAETVTIPYRENRALLFHSNLFHKSDQVSFKDGFENQRMNVTMLFGHRSESGRKGVREP
ncbi:MAG: tetratricopeptide repeat protein [Rhodospirillales bacterium]|nr:tetratricopeptide repeat protein [Rhodospirillales bacterium]